MVRGKKTNEKAQGVQHTDVAMYFPLSLSVCLLPLIFSAVRALLSISFLLSLPLNLSHQDNIIQSYSCEWMFSQGEEKALAAVAAGIITVQSRNKTKYIHIIWLAVYSYSSIDFRVFCDQFYFGWLHILHTCYNARMRIHHQIWVTIACLPAKWKKELGAISRI